MKISQDLTIKRLTVYIFSAIAIVMFVSGCEKTPQYPSALEAGPTPAPRSNLMPGDEIEVKFFYTPQLNEEQMIRPDGSISLQLVGEVTAQGKTPAELREELTSLYAPHVQEKLDVAVIVRSFRNQRVYVGGQVKKPGVIEMPGSLTALDAILEAGGFNMEKAEPKNVIVIRHQGGKRYGYSLDLMPILEGGETQPFLLTAQDIIYVPRTEIAKAGQWVDQHINDLIPKTGFIFTRTTGGNTISFDTSDKY